MDHYIDIEVPPDAEFAPAHLMNALFGKLHFALAGLGTGGVGVSFPRFNPSVPHLGACLRLHGRQGVLEKMSPAAGWLGGLQDHVRIGNLLGVPAESRFRTVRRVQAKSNPERLRRRQMRRHGYDEAEALRRIPDRAAGHERLDLPYISLRSISTGQNFRLFVEHGMLSDTAVPGVFSAYGLSNEATIPWF